MKDTLFISPENIYERTQVHSNIDSKMIVPVIKVCQDMYILPILGTDLYVRLQEGIEGDNLTADEVTLLKNYIRDCLIYYVVSKLPDTLSYQFWSKGVLRKTNEGSETANSTELIDLKNEYKNWAEFYGTRLMQYLIEEANGSNKFPQYINYSSRVDTVIPKKAVYETGIYLGGSDCRGCDDSREEQYGKKL